MKDPGPRPRLDWVDLDLIDVDRNYQRELKPNLVAKILAGFHWDKFGAVSLVERPDGRFNVTEGQHRCQAAREHPRIESVPAVITAQSDAKAEAQAFVAINTNRQAISSVERYWAGLTAGDEDACAISRVLAAAGCDVVPENGHYRPNLTNAITAVDRALKRYGHGATRRALLIVRAAWPDEAKALRGVLITALARIVRANEKASFDADMAGALRDKSFVELTAHAEGFRKLSGGSAETALARTLAEIHNRGRRTNIIYFGEGR